MGEAEVSSEDAREWEGRPAEGDDERSVGWTSGSVDENVANVDGALHEEVNVGSLGDPHVRIAIDGWNFEIKFERSDEVSVDKSFIEIEDESMAMSAERVHQQV